MILCVTIVDDSQFYNTHFSKFAANVA